MASPGEQVEISMRTILTKGQFAKRRHRAPSCVSSWIASGKISHAALIGTGMRARIWVEKAEHDLAASLDPSQQFSREFPANTRSTFFPLSPAPDDYAERPAAKIPSTPGAVSDRELDLARRAKADADRAEYEAEASRRKLLVDEGRWVVAEDALREWTRALRDVIAGFETFMTVTLARDVAYKHNLDLKALMIDMREALRKYRGEVSAAAREKAAMPPASREAVETDATRIADLEKKFEPAEDSPP